MSSNRPGREHGRMKQSDVLWSAMRVRQQHTGPCCAVDGGWFKSRSNASRHIVLRDDRIVRDGQTASFAVIRYRDNSIGLSETLKEL